MGYFLSYADNFMPLMIATTAPLAYVSPSVYANDWWPGVEFRLYYAECCVRAPWVLLVNLLFIIPPEKIM